MSNDKKKDSENKIFISFNQDFSCFSVGTQNGYHIYNCEPFGKCFSQTKENEGVGIVEMLFTTSLVAIVSDGEKISSSQRHLLIANTKRNSTICELSFASSILAIKINRKNIVVVLEEFIYVYDIGNMRLIETIDTCPNPNALCSLSPSPDLCYLAYPANTTVTGELIVYDVSQTQKVCIIPAHKSALSCISFSYSGKMIATASDKGTIIRVFLSQSGDILYQFRRGTYPAHIYSINFNITNTFLCVSSDSETVHIFKLGDLNETNESSSYNSRRPRSLISGVKSKVGSFLNSNPINTMLDNQRDFAFARLPSNTKGVKSICAISTNPVPQVMVATSNGHFYQYKFDVEKGGECTILNQFNLLTS